MFMNVMKIAYLFISLLVRPVLASLVGVALVVAAPEGIWHRVGVFVIILCAAYAVILVVLTALNIALKIDEQRFFRRYMKK